MPDLVEELDRQQLVRCIARFLQARGVQPRQQSRVIEEILGMSYSHTHRLIRGDVDWTVPQLMQVARHYDVTLAEVIAHCWVASSPSSRKSTQRQRTRSRCWSPNVKAGHKSSP